jgi:hypothetical protein
LKQYGLEKDLDGTLDTLLQIDRLLSGGLEILRASVSVGEFGVKWHDKGEEWQESVKAGDTALSREIRKHKADWLEVSDEFFLLGSIGIRVNGLLEAIGTQFTTFRRVEFVRHNARNHLDEMGISLD